MTSYTSRISPNLIDASRPGAYGLLVRHAEREPITPGADVLSVPLTPFGLESAKQFGALFRHHSTRFFYSSPVGRCMDTLIAILEGLGFSPKEAARKATPHRIMADAYINDPEKAKHVYVAKDPEQTILDYTAGAETPGFAPVGRGARTLLNFILDHMENKTLSLFVTHDALIMPFKKHFVGEHFSRDNWLPFLDGCVIYREENRVFVDDIEVTGLNG